MARDSAAAWDNAERARCSWMAPPCGPACIPVSAVENKNITTLEGLGSVAHPHALQAAFVEEQAAQCGYCMNGMVMGAKVLLDKNPHPTVADIKQIHEHVYLPVRHPPAGHSRHPARRKCKRESLTKESRTWKPKPSPAEIFSRARACSSWASASSGRPRRSLAQGDGLSVDGMDPTVLDSWMAIAKDGTVTVFTGKVELGTGVVTALAQIVAEELDVPFNKVYMEVGRHGQGRRPGSYRGRRTVERGGVQLRQASAAARQELLEAGLRAPRYAGGQAHRHRRRGQRRSATPPGKLPTAICSAASAST